MNTSKKIFRLLLVLFASVALIGCDSDSGGDTGDAERFLGSWRIVSAADMGGTRDQTAVFSALGTLTLTLNEDGTYSLVLVYTDPATPDLPITGSYSVNESSTKLTLNVQVEGFPSTDLVLDYVFNSDTEVEFTASAQVIALLLGADLSGDIILVAQKQ